MPGEGRGSCPVCGSKPIFSCLDHTGRRFLYCSLCGHRVGLCACRLPVLREHHTREARLLSFSFTGVCLQRLPGCLKALNERAADHAVPNLFWEEIKTVPLDMTVLRLGVVNGSFTV